MVYKLVEKVTTAFTSAEKVVLESVDKDKAIKALEDNYKMHKSDRRYAVTYEEGKELKLVLKIMPKIITTYEIKTEE